VAARAPEKRSWRLGRRRGGTSSHIAAPPGKGAVAPCPQPRERHRCCTCQAQQGCSTLDLPSGQQPEGRATTTRRSSMRPGQALGPRRGRWSGAKARGRGAALPALGSTAGLTGRRAERRPGMQPRARRLGSEAAGGHRPSTATRRSGCVGSRLAGRQTIRGAGRGGGVGRWKKRRGSAPPPSSVGWGGHRRR
jgi:hypothetical protein